MAKPKQSKLKKDVNNIVKTKGGKFARPMKEYKNHLKLVHSKQ